LTNKRVLVVDDEDSLIFTCVEELEQEGFEARGVKDGNQAIDLYKKEGFDLVLADLKMPGMDGMELLKAIMEYDPEASVVIMTAYGTVDIAVEALRSGAREFITKPFDIGALVTKLRTVLEQRSDKAVRGNLRDLGLASIISVNCNEHNQAELLIRRQGRLAAIYFEDGTIVHATLEDQEGDDVVYELLSWEDGSFALQQGVPPPKRTVRTDWTGLVLEGMRRIDDEISDLGLELHEGEGHQDENLNRVAEALKALERIEAVVICSQGGELLGQAANADPIEKATLIAFMGHRAGTLGILLNAGRVKQVVLAEEKRGTMILPHNQNLVGLSLAERTLAETMVPEIQMILRRYQ
jgi:CheY-like chemotaxis protein